MYLLEPVQLYACRGCGRTDLTADEMSPDRTKPTGLHSRCKRCKNKNKTPKATPPSTPVPTKADPAAAMRRDALVELVKRHRQEFDDIIAVLRHRDRPLTRKWRDASLTLESSSHSPL